MVEKNKMSDPYTLLEKAIVSRLKAAPNWSWPIYADTERATKYLEIGNVSVIDNSAKRKTIKEIIMSFDAWDLSQTGSVGTNNTILDMLHTLEFIITLDNHDGGLNPFDLGEDYIDASHQQESGPDVMPNVDQAIRHGQLKIRFKIAF